MKKVLRQVKGVGTFSIYGGFESGIQLTGSRPGPHLHFHTEICRSNQTKSQSSLHQNILLTNQKAVTPWRDRFTFIPAADCAVKYCIEVAPSLHLRPRRSADYLRDRQGCPATWLAICRCRATTRRRRTTPHHGQ
jgi:hypothetical protein